MYAQSEGSGRATGQRQCQSGKSGGGGGAEAAGAVAVAVAAAGDQQNTNGAEFGLFGRAADDAENTDAGDELVKSSALSSEAPLA